MILFSTTLIAAILHLCGVGHSEGTEPWLLSTLFGLPMIAATIVLLTWCAALHAINILLDRNRIASHSQRMPALLFRLTQDMEQTGSLQALAHITATESHQWVMSLSFRPPILPG